MTSSIRGRSAMPLLLLAPGFVGVVVAVYPTFVPDDLFIYLRFVHNLLARGEPAFNPGDPTYGFTSALWLAVLTLGAAVSGHAEVAARVASVLASVAALGGMAVLSLRLSGSGLVAWSAATVLALDVWFLRWSATGMEASLAVALTLWGFARHVRETEEGLGRAGSALLFALLALVRPEALLLVGLAVLEALLPRRAGEGTLRRGLAAASSSALVLAPWMAYATWQFGTLVPDTAPAKGVPGAAISRAMASLERMALLGGLSAGIPVLLLAVAAWLWFRGRGTRGAAHVLSSHRLLAAWLVGLPALYAITGVTVYSRYLLLATPLWIAVGLSAGWQGLRSRRLGRRAWAAAALATVAVSATLTLGWVAPASRDYARSFRGVNVALGRWLAENTPPGAVVAAENIGAIGFHSDRRILDMNGLVSPEIIPYKRSGRVEEYLAAHPPDFLIKIDPRRDPWSGGAIGLELEPIRVLAYEHMFIDQQDPLYYTLYRVLGPATGVVP